MAKNEIVQIKNLIIWQKENKIFLKDKKSKKMVEIELQKDWFTKYTNFNDFIDHIEEILYYNDFTIKGNFNEFIHFQRQISYCLHDVLLNFNILDDYEYLLFNFDSKYLNEKYLDARYFFKKNINFTI